MAKLISIANQKGGVGKTTTALNLATALSMNGYKVLAIDLDIQANLSYYLDFKNNQDNYTINDLMYNISQGEDISKEDFKSCVYHSDVNNIDYIASNIDLANAEYYLMTSISRETVLKRALSSYVNDYDYIIIDCLPSLGTIFVNALVVSDSVIIPVQTHQFAMLGLDSLEKVINQIKKTLNSKLEILGILPTMVDNTNISKEIQEKLSNRYNQKVFSTCIRRSVEAVKSTKNQASLCLTKNTLGDEYKNLALEVVKRSEQILC